MTCFRVGIYHPDSVIIGLDTCVIEYSSLYYHGYLGRTLTSASERWGHQVIVPAVISLICES